MKRLACSNLSGVMLKRPLARCALRHNVDMRLVAPNQ
jgi:hypothetical protein